MIKSILKSPVSIVGFVLLLWLLAMLSISNLKIGLLPSSNLPSLRVSFNNIKVDETIFTERVLKHFISEMKGHENFTSANCSFDANDCNCNVRFEFGLDLDELFLYLSNTLYSNYSSTTALSDKPIIVPIETNDNPILDLVITSSKDNSALDNDNIQLAFRDKLVSLSGVSKVEIKGTIEKYWEVSIKDEKLLYYDVSKRELLELLKELSFPYINDNVRFSNEVATIEPLVLGEKIDVIQDYFIANSVGNRVPLKELCVFSEISYFSNSFW